MRHLSEPIDDLDLVYMVYTRTETAVHAENRIVDDDAEGEEIKHVGEVLPDGRGGVFACAFEVKAVCL